MIRSMKLFAVLLTSICSVQVSCGGADSSATGDGDGDSGGDGDGDHNGDGDGDHGGDGDATGSSCRTNDDCDAQSVERCYAPGSTQSYACGAPGWCGQCSCGPEPTVPTASGTPCETSEQCPSGAAHGERIATVCVPELSTCQECATDDDCTGELPYCAMESWSLTQQCFACKTDADCASSGTVCTTRSLTGGADEAGSCVDCWNNSHCETGLCDIAQNKCFDQCQTDDDCDAASFFTCQNKRCEKAPCSSDADCGPQGACSEVGCVRKACTQDGDCDSDSYCVLGYCYSALGTCQQELAQPGGG